MEYKGLSLQEACQLVIHTRLPKIGGDGGLIAVDGQGNVVLEFNTEGMYRGQRNAARNDVEIYR
jgi:beta-aspartyl-peptidase (threonine type)